MATHSQFKVTPLVLHELHQRLCASFAVPGLELPTTAVKFFHRDETIPPALMELHPDEITLTSCQAARQASLGEAVLISEANIGCVAAAISLGLVDAQQSTPLSGSRVYTDIMRDQATHEDFAPPAPKDFSNGNVYACQATGHTEYCLFGPEESGRFADRSRAQAAIDEMLAIQPPTTQAVLFYTPAFTDMELEPDVVVLDVRPVELTRLIQAYQFQTGHRINASMGGLRVVNSDLIVRPYLTGEINVSSYCLGARLLAQYDANRLGMGIPSTLLETIVSGMETSASGYPFPLYPGAQP